MKILHLCTSDISGGAARSAYRLHAGLRRLGHDSVMLVAEKKSHDPAVKPFTPPTDFLNRLVRRARNEWITRNFARYRLTRPSGYEWFSDARSPHGTALQKQLPPCDLIHLRWVPRFVDYRAFFNHVSPGIPIVWTLDDMNPLTGGCHFDDECGKFASGCGACPQLGSTDPHDLSRRIWQRKLQLYGRVDSSRLHIVTPSRWMAAMAQRSPLLNKFPLTVIPYGLDTEVFAPRPRKAARSRLGLPQDVSIVLFVAYDVSLRRKGFALLARALAGLAPRSEVCLVSLGQGRPELAGDIPARHLGKIDDDTLLSYVYSAADVFVCPSLQDNLPNTVLESIACGTPVIAFDAGGIPDMVRPEVTGLLAPVGDPKALSKAMASLLRDRARRKRMAENCRRIACEEYTLEVQGRRYARLYESLVGNREIIIGNLEQRASA